MKLLVFGDSIAWGAFDGEGGGWVERLKVYGLNTYDKTGLGVYNFSVSSNDSRGVLKYLEHDLQKIKDIEPEDVAIIIAIGTNDPRLVGDDVVVPLDEFNENFRSLLSIAQGCSSKVLIVGGFPIDERRVNPWCGKEYYWNDDMRTYTDSMQSIGDELGVGFLDLWDVIGLEDLSDGLHPNVEGHVKVFEKVKGWLEEMKWL